MNVSLLLKLAGTQIRSSVSKDNMPKRKTGQSLAIHGRQTLEYRAEGRNVGVCVMKEQYIFCADKGVDGGWDTSERGKLSLCFRPT